MVLFFFRSYCHCLVLDLARDEDQDTPPSRLHPPRYLFTPPDCLPVTLSTSGSELQENTEKRILFDIKETFKSDKIANILTSLGQRN